MCHWLRRAFLSIAVFAFVGCGGGGGGGGGGDDRSGTETVPAPPSGLAASPVSAASINLTWSDSSTNEQSFKIERSTDGVTFTPVSTVSANTTSYPDTGLAGATKYYYRVRASNSKGDSAWSNTAEATTLTPLPAAPTSLSATAASTTSFTLAWTDNASNEDGFSIERSTSSGSGFAEIATVSAGVVSYLDTGLSPATTYYYRVRAHNGAGNSDYSNTATGTPLPCTNLCLQQVTCPGAGTTALTGAVYAPNGTDPLPNVIVYVPNAPVQPFSTSVTCETCSTVPSGSPLVRTATDSSGAFRLENVPVGSNIPLVIQTGRWRRQIIISSVPACVDTAVSASQSRLPRNRGEGDIPKMAFATGKNDALECVLRKLGINDAEFTNASGAGRINLYVGDGSAGGARIDGSTAAETTLVGTLANMTTYDMLFFPDKGTAVARTAAELQNLVNYANSGGRVFATRYSYVWLYQNAPFSGTANWHVDQTSPSNQTAFIDTGHASGQTLSEWLFHVGASTTQGQIPVAQMGHDLDGVVSPSQQWMYISSPSQAIQYSFNTPVGTAAAQQCGRVLFNDYVGEVPAGGDASGTTFPAECSAGAMTAQEKLLEYMIFATGACVGQ